MEHVLRRRFRVIYARSCACCRFSSSGAAFDSRFDCFLIRLRFACLYVCVLTVSSRLRRENMDHQRASSIAWSTYQRASTSPTASVTSMSIPFLSGYQEWLFEYVSVVFVVCVCICASARCMRSSCVLTRVCILFSRFFAHSLELSCRCECGKHRAN